MDIDLHRFNDETVEVIDFIYSGNLLSGKKIPIDLDFVIINRLEDIPKEDDYFENDAEYTWKDILSLASREIYKREFEKWPKDFPYGKFLSDLVLELIHLYNKSFPTYYKEHYLDKEIPGILVSIVHSRIVMGKENKFYEMLFKVFRSGGYPCGWKGNYPEGKLIVFYPKKDKIKRNNNKIEAEINYKNK